MVNRADGRQPSILVLGDVMLDRYTFGVSDRISPESPVLVVKATRREVRLGGAGNVAANCRALGAQVCLVGLLGADSDGATLQHLLKEQDIESLVIIDDERCTTVKDRILGQAAYRTPQHILRLDCETAVPAAAEIEEALLAKLVQVVAQVDLVLVSDYGKGVCTKRLLEALISASQNRGVPVFVDPAIGGDWSSYAGASLIKPNRRETEAATATKIDSVASAEKAASILAEEFNIPQVAITLDQDGILLYTLNEGAQQIACERHEVSDVTGAGDTVFAVLGVAVAQGLDVSEAARLANIAGGLQVERQGATTVTWEEIYRGSAGKSTRMKLVLTDWLEQQCSKMRLAGKRIVFTNGCFDLLHVGHVTYLEQAASLGDVLVVAINSDLSVRRLKGPDRPINADVNRAAVVAALSCVNYVVLFEEDTPSSLLHRLRPNVLVKGGDYSTEQVVGREIVRSYGGDVIVVSEVPGISTSNLLKKRVSPVSKIGE